ncbi:hypothetical protein Ga0123461_1131 [Mariprofundus aestuarium]|uniref:SpoIIAA-like n=1 Tax=Mariprofundus aestuarium TaxID=1921086 RepID=A0A2K8KX81_MARES|nr:hypothetical protein [Mariprofundus aestuarium]ATX79550.1 hypothetical protein Ga0123461_1131 [Mariprofundus aestuarium]
MPYSIIWESEGIYRIFSGMVNGEEVLESNIDLYDDVRFKSARYIINDFTEISGHAIEASHLPIFASTDEMISQLKHEFKIALIVPQDAYVGLANSLCELTKNKLFEYATFQTIDGARNWVGSKT